jgi:hypothetical protein
MSAALPDLCYACDAPATSREHAPPRCLFPKPSDFGGANLRRNLISVASCDEHNQSKRRDDEHLWYTIAMNAASGPFGRMVFNKGIMRAIRRRPALAHQMVQNHIRVVLVDQGAGRQQTSIAIRADWDRLLNSFELIARGLHLYHFGTRNLLPAKTIAEFQLHIEGPERNEQNRLMQRMVHGLDQLFHGQPMHGDNPRVFAYQAFTDPTHTKTAFRMHFYGGTRVAVLLDPVPV